MGYKLLCITTRVSRQEFETCKHNSGYLDHMRSAAAHKLAHEMLEHHSAFSPLRLEPLMTLQAVHFAAPVDFTWSVGVQENKSELQCRLDDKAASFREGKREGLQMAEALLLRRAAANAEYGIMNALERAADELKGAIV